MTEQDRHDAAPGAPGVAPHWTTSAKDGVGTALARESRVWFTISRGIVDEIYHPFIDIPNTRDFELLVTDGKDFFSEEKRDTKHALAPLENGVPGYRVTNTCREGRYRIEKTIVTDPERDVLLQRVRFTAQQGKAADYRLYALLALHLANEGEGNDAWVGEYKGVPMLFGRRADIALALACGAGWRGRSCGYVGASDGWQDIHAHRAMTEFYGSASDGNVALTGEIVLSDAGEAVLALGFGQTPEEAAQQARASLMRDFSEAAEAYAAQWRGFQEQCRSLPSLSKGDFDAYRTGIAVLKTHEGKRLRGGVIASLSIPWGAARGDRASMGYHVVWPRDQVEAAGAMLAAGSAQSAREILLYLMCTQEADGHWPQNMRTDGRPVLNGIQLDQTALPVLLAHQLARQGELRGLDAWPMVKSAAKFLLDRGPMTPMDRWEENAGYSPFTLAALVAGLLAAADFAERADDAAFAGDLRAAADDWNGRIEEWTYVTGTDLARRYDVDGYYVRIAPPEVGQGTPLAQARITLRNRPQGSDEFAAWEIVSPDALALVRFGLRQPDDPRIANTVRVIDGMLRTETQTGPVWHRYTHDGYGETADGDAYRGAGIGRGWPLLTGERAHYELSLGRNDEARRLLQTMVQQMSAGALLPEQVWDAPDLPERGLYNGRPSGSAMPLVWAHAEFVKLVRSLEEGIVFDRQPQTRKRYGRKPEEAR